MLLVAATEDEIARVTPEDALQHPTWDMGPKITIDSATMMNKGLEVIEACWLFSVPESLVDVVIHPQSVVHSMVQYRDGSVLAQLGNPDMRTPIAHALAWPERIVAGVEGLDMFRVGRLDFEPPDPGRFPCLRLAFDAVAAGGTAPAVQVSKSSTFETPGSDGFSRSKIQRARTSLVGFSRPAISFR